MASETQRPQVFISYSHLDQPEKPGEGEVKWLTFVQKFLGPLEKHGLLKVWDDRKIRGGATWREDICKQLDACDVCILLVSPNSLSSDFILDEEIKRMLERRKAEGVQIYPIVITPTPFRGADWLTEMNLRPGKTQPLSGYPLNEREAKMVEIVEEIADILEEMAKSGRRVAKPESDESKKGAVPDIIDYGRLPETPYEQLVGREEELKWLDEAWSSEKINIASLIAEGGVGKSALVNRWLVGLQEQKYRGARAVLGWSFFSQGTERATSADPFFNWALETLGVQFEPGSSASVKAGKLVDAMAARPLLLVLDGVEPLQHGPGPQQGQLKDLGLREFLRRFAAMSFSQRHSLIVLTSRLFLADIVKWKDGSAPVKDLGHLSDEAGAALLKGSGVEGPNVELKAASREAGGHALTLTLLAGLLRDLHDGDIRRRGNIRGLLTDPDAPGADRAARVMQSYEREWLAGEPLLQAVMRIMGLFDRPASEDCLDALRRSPAIEGLTDPIVGVDDAKWRRAIVRLREVRLLSPQDKAAPGAIDAHPLVREWFGERLQGTNEAAWREAHGRLYEHLRDTTKEGDRPTLSDLAPLYQAIPHGCRAGRHQETLDDIYQDRICRRGPSGELIFYAYNKLGAAGSDLAAIFWFFKTPYETPIATLHNADQSSLLNDAGIGLRSQGRLVEALLAMRASVPMLDALENWSSAAYVSSNVALTEILVGDVNAALVTAARGVELADRGDSHFEMIVCRSTQANAFHVAGCRHDAERLFADAESLQREWHSEYPLLSSLRGYEYCDLLLTKGNWEPTRERAQQILKWETPDNSLLDQGLVRLALGRAHLGGALQNVRRQRSPANKRDQVDDTCIRLGEAVEGLRAAGQSEFIAPGLLARAAFRRSVGDWVGAARDLDEVEETAELGPMRLFLCDMALERARLALAQIEGFAPLNGMLEKDNPPKPERPSEAKIAELKEGAAEQLKIAADYIRTCGYHRRDKELAELQAVLAGSRAFASLPPRV
jgi:TIR domain